MPNYEKQGTAVDSSLLFRTDRFGCEKRRLAAASTAAIVTTAAAAVAAVAAEQEQQDDGDDDPAAAAAAKAGILITHSVTSYEDLTVLPVSFS